MENDEKYMNRCLELASKGSGKVSPNPLVGCVIVHQNKIIGEGFHQKYGDNHAEVNAINSVKNQELLAASTLYVNLEPCSHFGKTPPCCELIVRKKIPKIVIGCVDVSSKVNGSGIAFLKSHNLEVTQNVLNEKCKKLNIRFFHFQKKQIPYIILKWAQTKDGFIDKIRDQNQKGINWITEKETQITVHKWRSQEDAILVGRKTIENDDPELTVREYTGINPLRIVIDSNLKLKLKHKVFNNVAPTVIVNNILEKKTKNLTYLKIKNKNAIITLLTYLAQKNVMSIIIEGGAETINRFIELNFWNEARVILGNQVYQSGVKAPTINKRYSKLLTLNKDTIIFYLND